MCWALKTAILLSAIVTTLQYDSGVSYRYSYQFTILLNEDSNLTSRTAYVGRHVGYKVSTDFFLTNVWQNADDTLLKLELMKPQLLVSSSLHGSGGETQHWSKLENLSYPPVYIHWNQGVVKSVYLLPDTASMINIKKGIAGLFQIRVMEGETEELDVSGLCKIRYKREGSTIKKTKDHCRATAGPVFNSSQLRSSTTSSSSELLYTLSPDGVREISGSEDAMIKLNLWSQAAVFVKSKIKLALVDQQANQAVLESRSLSSAIEAISKALGSQLRKDSLEVVTKGDFCTEGCKKLNDLVNEHADSLLSKNIGTMTSASGFLKLLDAVRRASKKELLLLFKNTKEELLVQLMDVLAASQTEESLDVAFELIDFESDDIGLAERFLHCLAVVPHPSESVIRRVAKLTQRKMKSVKLQATALITLSSLLKTYCKSNEVKPTPKVVQMAVDLITKGLKCTDPQCVLLQLYAVKNAAHPAFIPFLLTTAPSGGNIGRLSLEALKEIGTEHFTPEVLVELQRIYNEFWPLQDSTTRVLAAELLLRASPTPDTVRDLLSSLADADNPEAATLVLDQMADLAVSDPAVRSSLAQALQDPSYGNYNNLAYRGLSSAYTRLLQSGHDANVTYGINLEMRKTGMLKRTGLELRVANEEEQLPLLSLGLFVSGFGLTDEEVQAMDVPEEHSAGMELSVLGLHIRPYTFFTGTGELMGLVWSGVGSEMTPALQANLLFMDEKESLVLQSGLSLDFVLKAAISADISGTVEVSMWNKNAHATVKNSASLLVKGYGRVDTSFVESHVDFGLGGRTVLDVDANLDFSSKPMQICLQVEQPAFNFRHNVRKMETIPGSKHMIKTVKRRSIFFPARSLALHRNNYNTCRALFSPQPKSFW